MWAVADDTLLAGLGADDPAAAEAFVARFQRRVYGLARTITGDDRLAEDVAQEALLRAWRHAGSYDERRGSVATWLLAITRNLAVDALRVRRTTTVAPDEPVILALVAGGSGPAEAAVTADDLGRLRVALAALPVEQARAVVLTGLWGYSAREIALREGIPLGTAKTRIRTALRRLRETLGAATAEDPQ